MGELFFNKSFDYFIDRIKNNEHFRYSRFNDGELIAIIGKSPQGANCDGHKYFPEMGVELKNVLLNYKYSDNYVLESFDYWYKTLPHIKKILQELKMLNSNLKFLHTDFIRIMHEQNPELFLDFLEILKTKKIVIVGPEYLKKLNSFFDFRYISVPHKNCFLQKDRIISEMKKISEKERDVFFLLSASMPANIIIDQFKDNKNTYLDWGSVWDTFFVSEEYSFIKKRSTSNKKEIIEKYNNFLK